MTAIISESSEILSSSTSMISTLSLNAFFQINPTPPLPIRRLFKAQGALLTTICDVYSLLKESSILLFSSRSQCSDNPQIYINVFPFEFKIKIRNACHNTCGIPCLHRENTIAYNRTFHYRRIQNHLFADMPALILA